MITTKSNPILGGFVCPIQGPGYLRNPGFERGRTQEVGPIQSCFVKAEVWFSCRLH